ncbi:MAG: hypothetical protein ACR2FN_01755 [Chitinophagaceae bacterium]
MKKIFFLSILFLALLFAGCSSSKITNSWKADAVVNKPQFKKILVVGLFDENNKPMRQQMEDQLAQNLKMDGYTAVTSYKEFGSDSLQNMSKDETLRKLNNSDIDGVITINLVDKNKKKEFIAGPRYYNPYGGWRYNPYWGWTYRPFAYGSRGHYETNTNFVFETDLYDVNSRKLIYSAQSQSYDPSNLNNLANDYSRTIIKDLRKNNILS